MFAEYPKWVKVDGEGDPAQPGYVLVDNVEHEDALAHPTPADEPEVKRGRSRKRDA